MEDQSKNRWITKTGAHSPRMWYLLASFLAAVTVGSALTNSPVSETLAAIGFSILCLSMGKFTETD